MKNQVILRIFVESGGRRREEEEEERVDFVEGASRSRRFACVTSAPCRR